MTARRRLLITAAALLAGLLLAEAFVRWRFADEVDAALIRSAREALDVSPFVRGSADPLLAFETRPGLDMRFPGWRVVTDGRGLRVRTAPPREPRPAGRPLRIVVVGASGSFGLGVQAEDSWPHVMGDRLEVKLERPVEVLNLSVTAYVATQQARLFELYALDWDPDLVVWHYDHRDAFPVDLPDRIPVLAPEEGDNLLHSALLKLLVRRMRLAELEGTEIAMQDEVRSAEGYSRGGPVHAAHLEALRSVAAMCRERDVPAALFVFDTFLQTGASAQRHFDELHAPLLPQLREAGFHVFDLFPFLLEAMRQRGWTDQSGWWRSVEPKDGHFNAEGHAWLAERLAAWLTGDGKLLAR